MPDKIVIEGIEAYNGAYDFDVSSFTNRELHTIKRLSGIRAGELNEALAAGDNDFLVALTVIALQRNGKFIDEDLIWDAEAGTITIQLEEEAAAAVPPTQPNDAASSSDSGETSGTSGANGRNGSVNSPTSLPAIGPGSSEPSATSGLPT